MEEEMNNINLIQNKLILLASVAAMGRTTLTLNIIDKLLKRNISVLFLSNGLNEKIIKDNIDNINNLFIDDTICLSIEQVKEKCLKMKNENNIKLVVIDDVHFISSNNHIVSRAEEIKYIMEQLKQLAKELQITIFNKYAIK